LTNDANQESTEPLFTIKLRSGGTFSPHSLTEVTEWLARQDAAFQWLMEARKKDRQIDYIINVQFSHRGELQNAVANATNAIRQEQGPEAYALALSHPLRQRYERELAFTTDDPAGQFIIRIAKESSVTAAHLLWALLDRAPQGTEHPALQQRGIVLAALYTLGYENVPKSHSAAWAEVRQTISKEHEDLRKSSAEISSQYVAAQARIEEMLATQAKRFDDIEIERGEKYSELVSGHEGEMENIRKAFKTGLALHSAVTYLKERAQFHSTQKWSYAKTASAVAIVTAVLVGVIAFWIIGEKSVSPVQIAAAAFAATLTFWLLRILVRSLLSNMHLEQDLAARAVLVQTYLALIAEGGAIPGEDREKVIALVFRPTSDGLVRDDAAPPGWLSFMTGNR